MVVVVMLLGGTGRAVVFVEEETGLSLVGGDRGDQGGQDEEGEGDDLHVAVGQIVL